MKKLALLSTLVAATLLAACNNAAPQNQVFGDQGSQIMTISQVKSQYDDAIVTFDGYIQRQVSGEDYIVADKTGEVQVEIDSHLWNGLKVGSNDKVRIRGKVDKETFSTQVDAFSVEKVQ